MQVIVIKTQLAFLRPLVLFATILAVVGLVSCGGGGGGGSGSTSAAVPVRAVSGTVRTPGGAVALDWKQSARIQFASLLIPEARADLVGLAAVPDGSPVDLIRIDPVSGSPLQVIASTTTSVGRYSFDLIKLGIDYSTTLMVRIGPATGVQLRAFAAGAAVNLDPAGEAGVQLLLETIAAHPGTSLAYMSPAELDAFLAGVDMLTSSSNLSAGTTVAATVIATKSFLAANNSLNSYASQKIAAAHIAGGPGDLANYFPLAPNLTWDYVITEDGATRSETTSVGQPFTVNGIAVLPVTSTNYVYPTPQGGTRTATGEVPEISYYLKTAEGVQFHGQPGGPGLYSSFVPLLEIQLPAKPGDHTVTKDRSGRFSANEDFDGDGVPETITRFKFENSVIGYETVTVPKGTYRTLRIDQTLTVDIIYSSGARSYRFVTTDSVFLAPNVGPVRIFSTTSATNSAGATVLASTSDEVLFDPAQSGGGNPPPSGGGGTPTPPQLPPGTTAKTIDLVHSDLAYDASRNRLYAAVPGTEINGNSVAIIDPASGTVLQTIQVGSEPATLALSANGRYLYVGLGGAGQVVRVDLASGVLDSSYAVSLDPDSFFGPTYANTIAVLPGRPDSIAVSLTSHGFSPGYLGIAIYDGMIRRPIVAPGFGGTGILADLIAISDDGAVVYGVDTESTGQALTRFALDANGVRFLDSAGNLAGGGFYDRKITLDSGKLYLGGGRVVDPVGRTILGTYATADKCIPDTPNRRTFCVQSDGTGGTMKILSFDQANFNRLATLDTLGTAFSATTILRWGQHGLAVSANRNFHPATHKAEQIRLYITDMVP